MSTKRLINVKIITEDKIVEKTLTAGALLRDSVLSEGTGFSMPCGGNARCGNCRVKFLEGAPKPNSFDLRFLGEKELQQGVRLLCRCVPEDDCVVDATCKAGAAQPRETLGLEEIEGKRDEADIGGFERFGIAVDIGTTTIAGALVGINGKDDTALIRKTSVANHQKIFGADVISRIAAAEEGHTKELQRLVLEDIKNLVQELAEGSAESLHIEVVAVSGNTTMENLLLGMDVKGLGHYPYEAKSLDLEVRSLPDLFKNAGVTFIPAELKSARIVMFPGFSAFVGGDIVSGIYGLELSKENGTLLLDLGTNGEMAFIRDDGIEVTSTAAGPVFEAGGISCGVPSVAGAVCSVTLGDDRSVSYEVIGGEKSGAIPGICGTGVMEAVSEMVGHGIVDETGLLMDDYFEEGFEIVGASGKEDAIRITQHDVRNVQLGKAAIYSGAEALLQGQIPDRVMIAGGFGSRVNIEKVKNLRMFPESFDDKIVAVGNASLVGAVKYVKAALLGMRAEFSAIEELMDIKDAGRTVELAVAHAFSDNYMDAMNF
ncbi:MAG: ASKHA domain-containing protein [Butyrivibrio sp.]|nr:ASKHA domain-containing protein [Butyrivibrio sp.]